VRVHCQQGGLCVIVGEPGTGKSVVKQALVQHGSGSHPERKRMPTLES